ncbi:hypothetical protein N8I77_010625 [Diaporthe amygdali]|uniref:monoamine oxidase n=1 Tax=Phomopsis amygdali TaxID=1214568 RepID=A0AAD9S7F6_PHOAM|nr:hypothetical protein N8I77_010625 [Diaporthe amygdali]
MANPQAKMSHDGYIYTKKHGLLRGLPTYGVVQPERKVGHTNDDYIWEAVVIGAGYTGLIAARDLVKAEARDRVGGRTWSAQVDGTTFEMGGTWVSHAHGRLFAEMQRYGLKDDVQMTRTRDGGCSYFTLDTGSGSRKLTLQQAGEMTARAWRIFINVDGNDGRDICPLPYSILGNPRVTFDQVKAIDQLSCADRLNQVKDQLTKDELALMESLIPHIAAGTAENVGLLEMLRAQALQGFSPDTFEEIWTLYKIREGQSTLARRIFDDATRLGLQYSFKTPIKSIVDGQNFVSLTTSSGEIHRARRVINTIPLAVLPTIHFDPPLSPLRQEAIKIGHVNYLTKVHAEVEGDLRGLRGCTWPGELLYVYGDGFCAGDKTTRITSFAGDNRGVLDPTKEPERLEAALQRFHPMSIKKIVFHDWISDPYSMAGPAWYSAGYLTKYLAELQKRHGNVLMANSDWASGWRAFIEGAMEQGALAADAAMNEVGILGANSSRDLHEHDSS